MVVIARGNLVYRAQLHSQDLENGGGGGGGSAAEMASEARAENFV